VRRSTSSLIGNILLITKADVAYRQLLLESEGYKVTRISPREVSGVFQAGSFQLALISSELGVERTVDICEDLKTADPEVCVAVLAQRADYFKARACVDAIVHDEYSPGEFLSRVKTLIAGDRNRGESAANH
jgi:DNA-binding response OmpR family regulator